MKHSIKRIIQQIVDICLEKQIQCTINTEIFNISIYDRGGRRDAYYFGVLFNNRNITNSSTLLLSDLLKYLKTK